MKILMENLIENFMGIDGKFYGKSNKFVDK